MSNNTVFNIAQDSEGFIWIATREGLNKFDGQEVTSYYHNSGENSIPGNSVTQLLSTRSGKLFIGTLKGVAVYLKEKDSFSTLLFNGKSFRGVLRIIELSDSDVLISSREGIFLVNQDFSIRKISDFSFRDMVEYKTGIIWGLYKDEILLMNTAGEIIRKYSNDIAITEGFDMSKSNVECVFKDSRGKMWLGTKRNGLGYYNYENDQFHILQFKNGINPIEDNFVRVINEDMYGRLWIGTESGLYIYDIDAKDFQFYGKDFNPLEKGLNDKAIYSIIRSKDNLMWIGTYFGGVNYASLNPTGFNKIYADGGLSLLSGNAVSEIIETSDNKLWIGTEDGGISILNPADGTFEYLK
ncbi:MAG: hypothetical protein J7L71_02935, partial [Spirochaetaceae bacterium]|nr:hypothetical protein [Spirochaetaceae bacterium]